MRAHPFGGFGGAQRADAHQNENSLRKSEVFDLAQKGSQPGYVVAVLGLDELCSRLDFFGEALRAPLQWFREWILGGSEKQSRWARDFAAAQKPVLIPQRARGGQQ